MKFKKFEELRTRFNQQDKQAKADEMLSTLYMFFGGIGLLVGCLLEDSIFILLGACLLLGALIIITTGSLGVKIRRIEKIIGVDVNETQS